MGRLPYSYWVRRTFRGALTPVCNHARSIGHAYGSRVQKSPAAIVADIAGLFFVLRWPPDGTIPCSRTIFLREGSPFSGRLRCWFSQLFEWREVPVHPRIAASRCAASIADAVG